MKKFLGYLKDYIGNSYNLSTYLVFFLFTGILITVNYIIDFEDDYVDAYYGRHIRILWYFLLQVIPYVICLWLVTFRTKQTFWTDKWFWIKLIAGFAILGYDRAFHYHREFVVHLPQETIVFAYRSLKSLSGIFNNILPLFILYLLVDYKRRTDNFYGLTFKNVDYKAYGIMLAIMIPLIAAASFLPDFIEYYPKYKKVNGAQFAEYMQIGEWVAIAIYEFSYLSDFISIELFFRGFLIIGLAPHLGKHVVVPMACSYAVLHFGKPLGECISSVFGGYILGVIALYSRNIWGGVVLHMGVAALMELFAFFQLALRN